LPACERKKWRARNGENVSCRLPCLRHLTADETSSTSMKSFEINARRSAG
jgi:hypothetical protein